MKFKVVEGDLFDYPVIGHGCNAKGKMGAGVAKIVKDRFPDVYEYYKAYCNAGFFVGGDALGVTDPATGKRIYNLCTQIQPGPHAEPDFIEMSVNKMLLDAFGLHIQSVAIPALGCGIGGLEYGQLIDTLHRLDPLKTVEDNVELILVIPPFEMGSYLNAMKTKGI